eukprot:6544606-Prymnesium_polylepis.1
MNAAHVCRAGSVVEGAGVWRTGHAVWRMYKPHGSHSRLQVRLKLLPGIIVDIVRTVVGQNRVQERKKSCSPCAHIVVLSIEAVPEALDLMQVFFVEYGRKNGRLAALADTG